MKRPSKPSNAIIDHEKMPFSEAEVYAAFRQLYSIRAAKELARSVVDGVRDERWSEASAAAAIARGSRDPEEINSWRYFYPAMLSFLLAVLSSTLHARVLQWRERERRGMHRHVITNATFNLTQGRPVEPWPEQAVQQVNAQYLAEDLSWAEGVAHIRLEVARVTQARVRS